MDDRERGVYRKFEVERVDGSDRAGGKHDGCRYFVIDLAHDRYAPEALRAYANACAGEHPALAEDLRVDAQHIEKRQVQEEAGMNERYRRRLRRYCSRCGNLTSYDAGPPVGPLCLRCALPTGELLKEVDIPPTQPPKVIKASWDPTNLDEPHL